MKVHYCETEGNSGMSYRERGDASWVYCGKHIANEQVTISLEDVSCGSCLKTFEKRKAEVVAA